MSGGVPSVLQSIATDVEAKLQQRMKTLSESDLMSEVVSEAQTHKPHDFRAAFVELEKSSRSFRQKKPIIAEVKYASPSEGTFTKAQALSPVEVARQYLFAGATALSVLTEEKNFQGSLQNLAQIRKAFPNAILLMKDFVIHPYQIFEARKYGADAILLIVALIGKERTQEYLAQARSLGLSALVEVHDESELEIALDVGADIIGVNNRNLKTLSISLETSIRLISRLSSCGKDPKKRIVKITESGIQNETQISELKNAGYNGFLIGSAFMKTGRPGPALDSVFPATLSASSPNFRKIKICGLTREEDVMQALNLGAWALGFVFYSQSPRAADPAQVAKILEKYSSEISQSSVKTVGVFVNPTLDELRDTVRLSRLNTIQLHGDESVDFCQSVRKGFPTLNLIKAFRLQNQNDLTQIHQYDFCDAILLDSASATAFGGTGIQNDFNLAKMAKEANPTLRIILAGGLSPENIAEAFNTVQPYAVDASSRLESAAGVKSPALLDKFFENSGFKKNEEIK